MCPNNHDRHAQSQARVLTLERLEVAIARSREAGTRLSAVLLVGHADRTGYGAWRLCGLANPSLRVLAGATTMAPTLETSAWANA